MEIDIRLKDEVYAGTQGFALFKKENGKRYVARLSWDEIKSGEFFEPTLEVPTGTEIFTSLRNELRRIGLLENADQATVKRLENHLEDMRRLVFEPAKPLYVGKDDIIV